MKKYFIIVFLSVMLMNCTTSDQPKSIQVNSQWRGEGRDGIYNETGLLKEWHTDGPTMVWSYEGLGEGHSSPAIANEKLYVTGLDEDNLILYVLDLNGKLLTKKEIGKEWTKDFIGPRSTLSINDGKLYIYNALGKLFCLDEETLENVWSKDLFTDFDGRNIVWGVTESTLIVDEKIFITPGGLENNIIALDKNSGELIWSSPGEGTVSAYCSPQYISGYTVPIIVTSTADFIIALNADTGEKLWSYPQTNEWNVHPNTPLYYDGMILSNTGYGIGATMLRLTDGGKSVEEVWKNNEMDTQLGGVVRVDDYIYASGQYRNHWLCVNWKTGETKYKVLTIGRSNVIFADGMLYCYNDRGEVFLVKPNPEELEVISSFKVTLGTAQHWAHPIIYNGVLYIRHGDALMAYNIVN